MSRPSARRLWSLGAIFGILSGVVVLVAGDRLGLHGVRVLGALVIAAGCLCGVVRLTRDGPSG